MGPLRLWRQVRRESRRRWRDLYVELTAHGAAQAISYSITHDGAPQHDGTIDVHSTDHDSAGFLRDSVQEVVNYMIIQAAYAAHALAKSS